MSHKPILWMTIAGSSNIVDDRMVGWNIKPEGWKGFTNKIIKPSIDQYGIDRILLHNPFGARPEEEVFQFDQYLLAKKEGLKWLTNGFTTAWTPITKSGVEVIAYTGMLLNDPEFDKLASNKYTAAEWFYKVYQSLQPMIDSGMSIALDVGSHTPASHPLYYLCCMLSMIGVKTYVEPRPRKDCPHWHIWPVVTENDFWIRSNPDLYPDSDWAARDADLINEVIRFVRGYSQPIEKQIEQVNQIIADGHTPSVELPYYEQGGK